MLPPIGSEFEDVQHVGHEGTTHFEGDGCKPVVDNLCVPEKSTDGSCPECHGKGYCEEVHLETRSITTWPCLKCKPVVGYKCDHGVPKEFSSCCKPSEPSEEKGIHRLPVDVCNICEQAKPVAEEKCGQMIGDRRLVNVEPAPCVRPKGHDGFCVANWDEPSEPSKLYSQTGEAESLDYQRGASAGYVQGRLSMQGEVELLKLDYNAQLDVAKRQYDLLTENMFKTKELVADLAKANERWEKLKTEIKKRELHQLAHSPNSAQHEVYRWLSRFLEEAQ